MGVKTVWQKVIHDGAGTIAPGATVSVYDQGTTTLSTIFSDRDGTALGNPFVTGSDALAKFYADAGLYKIVAQLGSFQSILEDEPVGNSQEMDMLVEVNRPPVATDDEDLGYVIGQLWKDTSVSPIEYYLLEDATATAAVWVLQATGDKLSALTNTVTDPSNARTITLADNNAFITFTATTGGDVVLTIPSGLPDGFNFFIQQGGTEVVDWSASPLTVNNVSGQSKSGGQYGVVSFQQHSASVMVAGGVTA